MSNQNREYLLEAIDEAIKKLEDRLKKLKKKKDNLKAFFKK